MESVGGVERGTEKDLNPLCWTLLTTDPWVLRELYTAATTSELRRAGRGPDARDAEAKQSHPLLR